MKSLLRDVLTPVLLLVVVLIGQQCSGMKIIQGFAVEIFADVFTKVGRDLCFRITIKPLNWQVASFATDRLNVGKEVERAGEQKKKYLCCSELLL